jgi:hypothetical protein
MIRTVSLRMIFSMMLLGGIAGSALAGGMTGTVTNVDATGMATVKTDDGKEHKVKGEGWQVGAKVDCEIKEGKTSCKAI